MMTTTTVFTDHHRLVAYRLRMAIAVENNPVAVDALSSLAEDLASDFRTVQPDFDRARFLITCGLGWTGER